MLWQDRMELTIYRHTSHKGRTVAVDPEIISLGSTVIIDGQEYVAEDVGGAIRGMRIDKYMESHDEALRAGVVQADVWIVEVLMIKKLKYYYQCGRWLEGKIGLGEATQAKRGYKAWTGD